MEDVPCSSAMFDYLRVIHYVYIYIHIAIHIYIYIYTAEFLSSIHKYGAIYPHHMEVS
jgi:hypothetical protein